MRGKAGDLAALEADRAGARRQSVGDQVEDRRVGAWEKLDQRDDGGALRDQQAGDPFDRVGFGFNNLQLDRGNLQFQLASHFLQCDVKLRDIGLQ
jgi:hypothetical protein